MSSNFIKKCSILFILFLLIITAEQVVAATTGKIAGKIIDKQTGDALPGANVFISSTSMGASSNFDGNYFILNIPPGEYSVTCEFIGYSKITQTNIQIIMNRTTQINFTMEPTVIEGSEVSIVAERPIIVKDLTTSEQIVSGQDLEKSWVRTLPEVLETQPGVFDGQFRGSSQVQSVYMLDNISLNSGLLSDNFTGINTSTVQEISVQTGGYNAEYGNARSAIINVVTKENYVKQFNGTVIGRMRPAGKYHFGRNMYSKDNYDWTNYDLEYWTEQSQSGEFAGQNPVDLLNQWKDQITPSDTLADYAERAEYEVEATVYGGISKNLSVLLSGRYKRGVGIFPQAIPYNPEYTLQGNLTYKFNQAMKLKFGTVIGSRETTDRLSNYDSEEASLESGWSPSMQVTDPYASNKYALFGSWASFPEKRDMNQFVLKFTHVLNPRTFYEVSASYLRDKMDRSDRNNVLDASKWSDTDDQYKMVSQFIDQNYMHWTDQNESKVYNLKGDLTSQVNNNNLVKAGFDFKSYDFYYKHAMGMFEGGERWNLMNVYDGTPYEMGFYAQDKLEFAGLVVNAGLRLDMFNQNREAAENMFDPLAYETTTKGHVAGEESGIPGNPVKKATKIQAALSPRLGIAHPISDNTVLHFVYGHFYQRPSWTKMFGFPFINFTTDDVAKYNPYAKQVTYMDQWQGYQGNPDLGYEKTIQYEIGIDQNIADIVRLDITGYYKDATNEANLRTVLTPAENFYNTAGMISNGGYSDVRGIESTLETRLTGPFNIGLSHDVFWSWSGQTGYAMMYEPLANMTDVPLGLQNDKGAWSAYHRIKTWVNAYIKPGHGPELYGVKPLQDVNVYAYFWWRSGTPYTYHGPGDTSTKPNNMRWFSYYQLNLKIAKGFQLMGVRTELSADIRNVLGSKFYNMLYGDNMTKWQEQKDLPEKERLPKHWFSDELNEWAWYSYEVPPRQVYFQLKFDF